MKDLNYMKALEITNEKLAGKGIFLTVGKDKPNTMTIGWATIGNIWGKPVFMALVRPQRYTYDLLKESDEFSISVPTKNELKDELIFAGTKSGRDFNKFEGHGLTAVPSQKIDTPIIKECGLHFECKVRLVQAMTGDQMHQIIADKCYPAKDYHYMYFGEIVACYTTDE